MLPFFCFLFHFIGALGIKAVSFFASYHNANGKKNLAESPA
jgi:hypothetical protein